MSFSNNSNVLNSHMNPHQYEMLCHLLPDSGPETAHLIRTFEKAIHTYKADKTVAFYICVYIDILLVFI